MTRLLTGLGLIAALLVGPAALANDRPGPPPPDCEVDDPKFAPEGGIFLSTERGPDFEYTVTLEDGLAIATVGNDNCSESDGTVTVAGVTIVAPSGQGDRVVEDLGFFAAGTHTFDVTIDGEMSVWLLVESTGFDEEIACTESATTGDGVSDPFAVFTFLDNDVKDEDPCEGTIGVNLESEVGVAEQTVTFQFETDEFPSWMGDITWTPEPITTPVEPTDLDLDLDGIVDTQLQWCAGFDVGGTPILPAGESWCLVSQTVDLISATEFQVSQTVFGLVDPSFARPK